MRSHALDNPLTFEYMTYRAYEGEYLLKLSLESLSLKQSGTTALSPVPANQDNSLSKQWTFLTIIDVTQTALGIHEVRFFSLCCHDKRKALKHCSSLDGNNYVLPDLTCPFAAFWDFSRLTSLSQL